MATLLPVGPVESKTYAASGSLTSNQFHIVILTAASTVAIAGANGKCLGVLRNKPADGGQASVVEDGEAEVFVDAGTAILIDDYIVSDGSGHGVKKPTTAETICYVLGRAKEAKASGTGTIIVDVEPCAVTNPGTT
jgi:hypothetical protein